MFHVKREASITSTGGCQALNLAITRMQLTNTEVRLRARDVVAARGPVSFSPGVHPRNLTKGTR